jgi:hypothetical protein
VKLTTGGRGPLVGHGALLVGRQAFITLLKMTILDKNVIKIILKSTLSVIKA